MASHYKDTLTREITEYALGVTCDSVPEKVTRRAKEAVVDGIGQFTDETVLRPDVREMMSKVTPYPTRTWRPRASSGYAAWWS